VYPSSQFRATPERAERKTNLSKSSISGTMRISFVSPCMHHRLFPSSNPQTGHCVSAAHEQQQQQQQLTQAIRPCPRTSAGSQTRLHHSSATASSPPVLLLEPTKKNLLLLLPVLPAGPGPAPFRPPLKQLHQACRRRGLTCPGTSLFHQCCRGKLSCGA